MVMHARKHPRLNDGYYDRHNYHEARSNSDYDRKPPYERRREDYSMSGQRQNSPGRYNHKLPYIDRIRPDKERYEKYNRDGERLPRDETRAGSYEKRSNNAYTNSVKHHTDSKHSSDSSSDTTDKILNSQSRRRSKDRDVVRKTDDKRETTSNSSERDSNNKTQSKDHRQEAQKTALRVCGDWSEHVSSSGKKYFYNCKTEVSQWVKPKEWKLADQAKLEAQKSGGTTSSQGGLSTKKNGSIPHADARSDSEHSKDRPPDRAAEKSTSLSNHDHNRQPPHRTDSSSSVRQRHGSNNQRETGSHHSTPTRHKIPSDNRHSGSTNKLHNNSSSDNRHSSSHSTPRSSSMDTSSSPGVAAERISHKHITNGTENSGDDMDISPDGSPKPSSGSHHKSRESRPPTTTAPAQPQQPQQNQQQQSGAPANSSGLPAPDQSLMWGQALQTLQTLQEVLTRRSNSISQPNNAVVSTASPKSAASQSPKTIPLQNPHQVIRERQPEPVSSEQKDRSSPAVSDVSQHSTVSSAVLTADSNSAPLNQSINLPASLINHYDPSLISHVAQWPAEQIELRASMVNAEGVIIGGHHCGQVSTELKRDRSQVRIAEVQSTLIEHRIHFLKQQISELETQDKGSYSGSTT